MIHLEPLAKTDRDRVDHVAVLPEQEPFCGSIEHHFAADEPSCDFNIVVRDRTVVGFFKIDRDYAAQYRFANKGELGLRGLMIDAREQGRGTGKAAMAALRTYVSRLYPDATALVLTVNIVNDRALAVYLAAGFEDTGELHYGGKIGPQHILRLRLKDTG